MFELFPLDKHRDYGDSSFNVYLETKAILSKFYILWAKEGLSSDRGTPFKEILRISQVDLEVELLQVFKKIWSFIFPHFSFSFFFFVNLSLRW